jgi:hypothetical protein
MNDHDGEGSAPREILFPSLVGRAFAAPPK